MTVKIDLIQFPFHLGQENLGSGKGPHEYLKAGLDRLLKKEGFDVKSERIHHNIPFDGEQNAVIRANKLLAKAVKKSVAQKSLPIILSGNCNACLGVLSGLSSSKPGVIWFDSHGDFNTPETTPSGYFDGMPLAIACGRCFKPLRMEIGLHRPLPESRAMLVGIQDLDPLEKKSVAASDLGLVTLKDLRKKGIQKSLAPHLKNIAQQTKNIYLHFDIDVLNKKEAPGVDFRCPDGLSLKEMRSILEAIVGKFHVKAISLTCYNPEHDLSHKTLKTGLKLIQMATSIFL